jgi:hypothetical protein
MIPRTPVGICMRIAFKEVWWSGKSREEYDCTYETETFSNDTAESTDTTGWSSTAAKSQRCRVFGWKEIHKYIAAHM